MERHLSQKITVPASEGHRGFGKLLKRVYGSSEHLIIKRGSFPMMSYQEYERLVLQKAETVSISIFLVHLLTVRIQRISQAIAQHVKPQHSRDNDRHCPQ